MDGRLVAMKMMCQIECVRLYAAASHQSSLIVARLFSTLLKKCSPSSALPLLFLRCVRDDEIDGRSVYPSR